MGGAKTIKLEEIEKILDKIDNREQKGKITIGFINSLIGYFTDNGNGEIQDSISLEEIEKFLSSQIHYHI